MTEKDIPPDGIAIIGLAGRFPKASHVNGVHGILEEIDKFDAAFFGIAAEEARIMDPQVRVFLECAWEAMENAGCDPERLKATAAVFAGTRPNTYLINNLIGNPELADANGSFERVLADDKEDLASRVASRLKLAGPSLTIRTGNSLAAVCVACQQLLTHQCDVALAGDVSITIPQADAADGIGIVALKRAADALADGDQIYAIIKGFALNHGDEKARVEAVALAEAMAGIEPGPDDSKRPGGIRELIRVAGTLHCAGISEFAGGANAHVVLHEAPKLTEKDSARPSHLILVSARTEPALQ